MIEYGELETSEGEKKLFKLAKKRKKTSKDLTQIKQMKNEQGQVLTDKYEITK
jgi:DNA-binding Xre family transcriptional regulator